MKKITISTEYITLGQFLKLAGVVGSGVDAKLLIQNGEVIVNNQVEYRRGRKLYQKDVVFFDNESFIVVYED